MVSALRLDRTQEEKKSRRMHFKDALGGDKKHSEVGA